MVDALDSKSCVRKGVRVRVPSPAERQPWYYPGLSFDLDIGTRNEEKRRRIAFRRRRAPEGASPVSGIFIREAEGESRLVFTKFY